MGDKEWVESSLQEVYQMMGVLNMSFEYVPLLEERYNDEGLAILDYDYENRIPIIAAMNTDKEGDADFEYERKDLKNTRENVTIQFTRGSILPNKVKARDAIDVTIGENTERYIILGNDNGIVLSGIYYSVRATAVSGALQDYEVLNNGIEATF